MRRKQSRNKPSDNFMMFALWTTVTFLRDSLLACSKANRAMRVEAFSVMIFKLSTTPGTTMCSKPAYKLSVFSRTMIRSSSG